MARNSRFRTTSGPSAKKRFPDKGKSSKKFFRDKGPASESAGDFSNPKRDGKYPERKPPVNARAGNNKSYPKRGGSFSEKSGPRPAPGEFKREPRYAKKDETSTNTGMVRSGPEKTAGEFKRQPRSFSQGDKSATFKKRGPGYSKNKGFSENRSRPEYSDKRKFDDKSDRKIPRERKSFVESRLDQQKKSIGAETVAPTAPKDDLIRLNKFISNSGVCSRREADDLIAMGLITVNGKSITEMGYKVKPTDDVRHDGKRLKAEMPVYILLNKPKGFITTTDDPQERHTVMQLIQGACKERVYPVGRLDRNTSGLLLLTNDGDLTEKLSHPSHNVKKIYKAELDRPLTKNDFQKILDGVRLEEGKAMVDDLAIVSDDGKTVGLEIHIGWNRIVRRIFEALDYEVVKLDRSVYATLDKKDLPRGHWRFLRQDEIIRLKHFQ